MIALLIGVILIVSLMIPAVSASDESTYDLSGATLFVFSDAGIEVTEGDYSGYKIDGTSLSIKDGGVYVV
ncbi:MAG: hypothetical protein IKN36_08345, partial [Clostridia bacterium]|nr:hypothetical protein [Clostridia bacterium]